MNCSLVKEWKENFKIAILIEHIWGSLFSNKNTAILIENGWFGQHYIYIHIHAHTHTHTHIYTDTHTHTYIYIIYLYI